MSRTRAAAAALLWPLLATAASACPSPGAARVTVETAPAGVDVRAVDSVEAQARLPLVGPAARAGGWSLKGLTVAEPDASFSLAGWQGRDCYAPVAVTVALGFRGPLRVFVPRRYPEGSCALAAILGHEMQHVEVHRLALQVHAPRVRAAVEAALAAAPGYRDQAEATAALGAVVEAAARAMTAAAGAANAALDTAEGYAAVQARCDDW